MTNPLTLRLDYINGVRPGVFDFSGTGMTAEEFTKRVEKTARIAIIRGAAFGTGGESYLRFNIACPRAQIVEAVARLRAAFSDLQ